MIFLVPSFPRSLARVLSPGLGRDHARFSDVLDISLLLHSRWTVAIDLFLDDRGATAGMLST
jgi:hypothetical protein